MPNSAGSCMLLKSEYNTDEEDDEDNDSSTGSDVEEDEAMPEPGTQAYQRLPAAVRHRLEQLSGQIESLIDENSKLKEVKSTFAQLLHGYRCCNTELSWPLPGLPHCLHLFHVFKLLLILVHVHCRG